AVLDGHDAGLPDGDLLKGLDGHEEVVVRRVADPACVRRETVVGRAEIGRGEHDGGPRQAVAQLLHAPHLVAAAAGRALPEQRIAQPRCRHPRRRMSGEWSGGNLTCLLAFAAFGFCQELTGELVGSDMGISLLLHFLRGPCDEARSVLPATGERRSCPPYPCQVDRTTAYPPMLVSGRLQSRRVGHVVGPAVRGHEDVAARSTSVISFHPPKKIFLRLLIRVSKMRSCNEPSGRSEGRLVFDPDEHPGDLSERMISDTNLEDLAERVVPDTNPRDLAERVISGTNLRDLVERVISGTSPGDLVERVISGTNPGNLSERVISGTNPGDLVEGILVRMISSDSSSSVRVISSPRLGGVSQSYPEASPSGVFSGPPLPVDSRALRDLEVMRANHNLDTAVTEGSLVAVRDRYSIPAKYGLHVPQPGQPPLVRTRPVYRMDLGELRGMPKVSGGKAPSTRAITLAREVSASPARETPKVSSKQPIDASTEQVDDPARRPKKVKVLTRRHKSRHGEGESRSCSKGKELAAPSKELEMPAESDEGGASPIHHLPRSMKHLFKTKVHKDDAGYYMLH
ncbi:hypothetical protein GW17_00058768, partial [Ensete ventricosum]